MHTKYLKELASRKRYLDAIAEREKDLDKKDLEISDKTLNQGRSVEFYSQSYASFYNTKLEKDKSILTLSTAGLGFLITLINMSNSLPTWAYSILIPASFSFLICIYTAIKIFDRNGDYIISLVSDGEDPTPHSNRLKTLDKIAEISFYTGIGLSFILGLAISINATAESFMKDVKGLQPSNESFAQADLMKKSFTGAQGMKPSTAQSQSSSSAPQSSNTQAQVKKP